LERKKASEFPQELLNLFDRYVHGDIQRRDFLEGAKKFAVGGLTAAALLESLRPNYAWAEQIPKDDGRIKTERTAVDSPSGNGKISGYLARPAQGTKWPGVLVVHENRGLNPYIEDVARRLAVEKFLAFAPDGLTSVGGYPGDDEKGGELFRKVDREKMTQDFVAAADWLKGGRIARGKSAWWDFVSAAALRIHWQCEWAAIYPERFRFTAGSRRRPMWRRSKRLC